MTATFPTSLDSLTNPTGGDNLGTASVLHSTQHSDLNDIVEALEAKLGITASTPVAGSVLASATNGQSTWSTSPSVNGGLNVGSTASGATAGAIRAGISVMAKSAPTSGAYTTDNAYHGVRGVFSGSVTNGNSINIGSFGVVAFVFLFDSGGQCTIVHLNGSTAVTQHGAVMGAWNIGSDAGTVWAVFHDGTNFVVKNRSGATRSFAAMVLG